MWPQTQVPPPFTEGPPFRCSFPLIPLSLPFLWSSLSANKHALESPMKKRMIPSRYFCIYLFLSSQESPSKELHTCSFPRLVCSINFCSINSSLQEECNCHTFRTQHTETSLYPISWSSPPFVFLFLSHYLFISIITQSITVLFIIQLLTAFFFY